MPIESTYTRSLNYPGLPQAFALSTVVSSDLAVPFSVSLAAAKTGSLTTRTDANTGVLTMAGGHGIINGDRLDVYWTGGSRRGMSVTGVATNAVSIDGGAGDDLPSAATSITAQVPTEEPVVVDGDNVVAIGARFPNGGTIVFADASDVELAYAVLTSTNNTYTWASVDGGTNPLAGDSLAKVFLSQGNSATASTATGLVQYDG